MGHPERRTWFQILTSLGFALLVFKRETMTAMCKGLRKYYLIMIKIMMKLIKVIETQYK